MRGYHAGMCSSEKATTCGADVPEPVSIRKSLFFNPDSIAYYTAIAAREDDPRALFIAGMAAHLYAADPDFRAFIDSTSSIQSSPIYGVKSSARSDRTRQPRRHKIYKVL